MKNLNLVLSGIFCLTLAACGGKDSSHESGVGPATVIPPTVQGGQQPAQPQDPTPVNPDPGPVQPPAKPPAKNPPGKVPPGKKPPTQNPPTTPVKSDPPACDNSGPVADYSGYIKLLNGTLVPTKLSLGTTQGNTTTSTQFKATLETGLFGGVAVAADKALFDWDSNYLTATFTPALTGGTAVEIDGHIKCGTFTDAIIKTKNGDLSFIVGKATKSPFDGRQEFKYKISFPTSKILGFKGVMTISRIVGTSPSSDVSDLPQIPNLVTTFRFDSFTTISTDWTHYDPLTGILQASMGSGTSFVKCQSVTLTQKQVNAKGDLEAPSLSCDITSGAAVVHKMNAELTNKDYPVVPQYFSGDLIPTVTGVDKGKSIAQLIYLGQDGKNPPGYVFPTYPLLTLRVFTCENNSPLEADFTTASVDQISALATFRMTRASTGKIFDFADSYDFGWLNMNGPIKSPRSGQSPVPAKYNLKELAVAPDGDAQVPTCDNFPKQ